jgi:nucleotide-binding universal stress UspA family protein
MTENMRRILVPVDFSVQSEQATRYACDLAEHVGAGIELLHVVDDPFLSTPWRLDTDSGGSAEPLDRRVTDASSKLMDVAAAARRRRVPVRFVILEGRPARMIAQHAAACGFDLIVMGTHRRRGLAHLIRGSVSEQVRRTARCPVLTLTPETATNRAVRDIALAGVA